MIDVVLVRTKEPGAANEWFSLDATTPLPQTNDGIRIHGVLYRVAHRIWEIRDESVFIYFEVE